MELLLRLGLHSSDYSYWVSSSFSVVINLACWQAFETSLAKKENYIRELESSLFEQKEINCRQHNEIQLLNERITNEARRVKMLEREGDRLRSEISLLESKVCVPRDIYMLLELFSGP